MGRCVGKAKQELGYEREALDAFEMAADLRADRRNEGADQGRVR